MKTILFILASLSLLPLVSTAKMPRPLNKTVIPNSSNPAFKAQGLSGQYLNCGSACMTAAEKVIDRESIQALNRVQADKEGANAIGSVLKSLPAAVSSLESKGLSPVKVKSSSRALVVAITKSETEDWDTATQANVVDFVEAVALDPVANQKQLEEVRKDCR